MTWVPSAFGRKVRAASVEAGRLLIRDTNSGRDLLISTAIQAEDGKIIYSISNEQTRRGLFLAERCDDWLWDVTDIAEVRLDFTAVETAEETPVHGRIACDRGGECYILSAPVNGPTGWVSLKSFDAAMPSPSELLIAMIWKVVVRRDIDPESATLFDPYAIG
jgi:hypothetical protein